MKQTTVGVVGLLLAHPRWPITVTNTSPFDAANVHVNDAAEPSCRTAASTFDLAAGASKQVFCSTSILVSHRGVMHCRWCRYRRAMSACRRW